LDISSINSGIVPVEKTGLAGGFNHLEKYESQWEGLSHIKMEKNV